jgi:hypothetical protein
MAWVDRQSDAAFDWYTVTLHAMLNGRSWLSDTVRVMPTDRFVYLPVMLR